MAGETEDDAAQKATAGNGQPTGFLTVETRFRSVAPARYFAEPAPGTASIRAYMREGLPALYREQDFTMRLVGALEESLDPIVAILDSLPAYFDADLAPQDLLEMLTAWLGVELDETQPEEQWRHVVRSAMELGRARGTRNGIAMTLELAFPDLKFRVEDTGGVTWADSPDELPEPAPPGFVVYCDTPVPEERMPTIARVIDAARPAHAPYRLRVRKPRGAKKAAEKKSDASTKVTEEVEDKSAKTTQRPKEAKPADKTTKAPKGGKQNTRRPKENGGEDLPDEDDAG